MRTLSLSLLISDRVIRVCVTFWFLDIGIVKHEKERFCDAYDTLLSFVTTTEFEICNKRLGAYSGQNRRDSSRDRKFPFLTRHYRYHVTSYEIL
jgi:hypothetical protein